MIVDYQDSLAGVVYYSAEMHPEMEGRGGRERARWYGVGMELPLAFFDGTRRAPQITIVDSFYPIYQSLVDASRAQKTVLEMELDSVQTRIESGYLHVGVHITPTDSVVDTMSTLRLVAVVFEDSVPYYSFLRGETTYARMVVREVIGDSLGVPLQLRFGQDFDTVLTAPVTGYSFGRVGVAVSVQEVANRAVLQSVIRRRVGN